MMRGGPRRSLGNGAAEPSHRTLVELVTNRLPVRARRLSGAVVAPFTQALTSLILQIIAIRALTADHFATFSILYSGLVVLTAISTGLVGDSLTVLDRHRQEIRSGLLILGLGAAGAGGVLSALASLVFAGLSIPTATLVGAATAAFLIEDLLRRLFMARLQFWRVVSVDIVVLVITAGTAVVLAVSREQLGLAHLVGPLLLGQVAGLVFGLAMLPSAVANLSLRRPATRVVIRFGIWRALQQGVRTGVMMAFRVLVVLAVGSTLFASLEAARIYTSPALLAVNGTATFLLASAAADRHQSTLSALRQADATMKLLAGSSVVTALAALVLLPIAGHLVTGGEPVSALAVLGWMGYAAASALAAPYASLASVRGHHRYVVAIRACDALVSLAVVALLLGPLGAPASTAPLGLAVGGIVIVPLARRKLVRSHAFKHGPGKAPSQVRAVDGRSTPGRVSGAGQREGGTRTVSLETPTRRALGVDAD